MYVLPGGFFKCSVQNVRSTETADTFISPYIKKWMTRKERGFGSIEGESCISGHGTLPYFGQSFLPLTFLPQHKILTKCGSRRILPIFALVQKVVASKSLVIYIMHLECLAVI